MKSQKRQELLLIFSENWRQAVITEQTHAAQAELKYTQKPLIIQRLWAMLFPHFTQSGIV